MLLTKKLPEEARLAAEFGCSELTITKRWLLVREGLVLLQAWG